MLGLQANELWSMLFRGVTHVQYRKVSMDLCSIGAHNNKTMDLIVEERWMWGQVAFLEGSTGGSRPFRDHDLVRN